MCYKYYCVCACLYANRFLTVITRASTCTSASHDIAIYNLKEKIIRDGLLEKLIEAH